MRLLGIGLWMGLMGMVFNVAAMEIDTDRPGLDYHSFDMSAAKPELCQASCAADMRCKAWTYVKPGVQSANARCWLKHAVPQANSNSCCVSGVTDTGVVAKPTAKASAPAGDCRALREHYDKRCGEMGNHYSKLNCERFGYSGCALDVAGCFTPYLPGHVFNDKACGQPGYPECASHAYDNYVECLASCNQDAIDGKLPEGRPPCAKRCQESVASALKQCAR